MLAPIGHGIDVVDITQFKQMLYDRIDLTQKFHTCEIDYANQFSEPWKHLAGCFAAKEAFLKAMGTGWAQGIGFLDIKLERNLQGVPCVIALNKCSEKAASLGFDHWSVSLSYTGNLAFASVIACSTSPSNSKLQ